jgi:hypothetical protein
MRTNANTTFQGTTLHFRRVVPRRLRKVIGMSEIWASLGCASTTVARARAGLLYAAAEEVFAVAESIRELELRLLKEVADERAAIAEIEARNAEMKARISEMRALAAEAKHHQNTIARVTAANEALSAIFPSIERARGRIAASREAGERAERMAAHLAAAAKPGPSGPPASTMFPAYFVHRETIADATHQVMGQDRGTLARFVEICGDRPVDGYKRGDITVFLNTMRQMPSVYGRSPKDAELSELENESLSGERMRDERRTQWAAAEPIWRGFMPDGGAARAKDNRPERPRPWSGCCDAVRYRVAGGFTRRSAARRTSCCAPKQTTGRSP